MQALWCRWTPPQHSLSLIPSSEQNAKIRVIESLQFVFSVSLLTKCSKVRLQQINCYHLSSSDQISLRHGKMRIHIFYRILFFGRRKGKKAKEYREQPAFHQVTGALVLVSIVRIFADRSIVRKGDFPTITISLNGKSMLWMRKGWNYVWESSDGYWLLVI